MKKMITINEFPGFLSQIGGSISTDERDEFIKFIAKNPEAGDIRVIYYFYDETAPVFLLTVYGKGEKENLTFEQKKQISALAQMLKAECKNRRSLNHD